MTDPIVQARAEAFIRSTANTALSAEHDPDERELLNHENLLFQRDCDITEARVILALLDAPAMPQPTITCIHMTAEMARNCQTCNPSALVTQPAQVSVAEAAKVLLAEWRESKTIDADEKAQDQADIHECDVEAGRIIEIWLHTLSEGDRT